MKLVLFLSADDSDCTGSRLKIMDCAINIRYGGAEPDDEGPESRIGHSKSKRVGGEGGYSGVKRIGMKVGSPRKLPKEILSTKP